MEGVEPCPSTSSGSLTQHNSSNCQEPVQGTSQEVGIDGSGVRTRSKSRSESRKSVSQEGTSESKHFESDERSERKAQRSKSCNEPTNSLVSDNADSVSSKSQTDARGTSRSNRKRKNLETSESSQSTKKGRKSKSSSEKGKGIQAKCSGSKQEEDSDGEIFNEGKRKNSMTTRSQRAKEIGETRFVFDKVCDCKEESLLILHGRRVNVCACGEKLRQFLTMTGQLEEDGMSEASADPTVPVSDLDMFNRLSIEIMCYIFKYLSFKENLKMESLSSKIQKAVHSNLKLVTKIDFMEDIKDHRLFEDGLYKLTNWSLMRLISKLPKLKYINNFHPSGITRGRSSGNGPDELSTLGIASALMSSRTLQGIEISSLELLEVIGADMPHVTIGRFANRAKCFPPASGPAFSLKEELKLSTICLVGCKIVQLPAMDTHLEQLHLRFVVTGFNM